MERERIERLQTLNAMLWELALEQHHLINRHLQGEVVDFQGVVSKLAQLREEVDEKDSSELAESESNDIDHPPREASMVRTESGLANLSSTIGITVAPVKIHVRRSNGIQFLTFTFQVNVDGNAVGFIEKGRQEFLNLEQSVRAQLPEKVDEIGQIPDKNAFAGTANARQTGAQLQAWLQNLLNLCPDYLPIIIFLRTNTVPTPTLKESFRKQGFLSKKGNYFGGWKTRHFNIDSNSGTIFYSDAKQSEILGSFSLQWAYTIPLAFDDSSDKPGFVVSEYKKSFFANALPEGKNNDGLPNGKVEIRHVFYADTVAERDAWVRSIAGVITKLRPNDPIAREIFDKTTPPSGNTTQNQQNTSIQPSRSTSSIGSQPIPVDKNAGMKEWDDLQRRQQDGRLLEVKQDMRLSEVRPDARQLSQQSSSASVRSNQGNEQTKPQLQNVPPRATQPQQQQGKGPSNIPPPQLHLMNHNSNGQLKNSQQISQSTPNLNSKSSNSSPINQNPPPNTFSKEYKEFDTRVSSSSYASGESIPLQPPMNLSTTMEETARELSAPSVRTSGITHSPSHPSPTLVLPPANQRTSKTGAAPSPLATPSSPSNARLLDDQTRCIQQKVPLTLAEELGLSPIETKEKKKKGLFGDWMNKKSTGNTDKAAGNGSKRFFGISIQEAAAMYPIKEGVEIPTVVYRCIEYLDAKNAADEEGIYRLSGASSVIGNLKAKFEEEGDVNLLDEEEYYDPHAIAGLLKLFFRELSEPLFTFALRPQFFQVAEISDRTAKIKEVTKLVASLPNANYASLRSLLSHLLRIVQKSEKNKMTVRNVSIVFSPTLGVPAGLFTLLLAEFSSIFIWGPMSQTRTIAKDAEPPIVLSNPPPPRKQTSSIQERETPDLDSSNLLNSVLSPTVAGDEYEEEDMMAMLQNQLKTLQ